ncbi:MAG: Na(+)-translocating NADH-quinone reductase subunit A [Cyclobacteriaceae bacterium]|nr:Na(+)-translocating NADH-quinone reductase subunit A [Cyclobacteriaceae bacterium]
MSKTVKLRKGFDINLAGKAENKISDSLKSRTYALKPTDFIGMQRPKALVNVGDNVKAGTPLLLDKKNENVIYVSPVSGEVVDVKRGEKRALLEIVVLADSEIEYESFNKYSVSDLAKIGKDELKEQMLRAGVWPNILMRPYGIVADAEDTPKSIFISAFDSSPLAPDYNVIFKGEEQSFQAGINVLKKFTEGIVHLNVNPKEEISPVFLNAEGVQLNKFIGKHPAGNVGVQIHHVDPISKGDVVWTVNPYGVIQIGKLFLEGKYDASKIVALAGSEVTAPQYVKTYTGAAVKTFTEGNLKSDHVRYVSGNVLTGENIGEEGHLGFYHNQFTILPEGDYFEMFGWILPRFNKLSFHRSFGLLTFLNGSNKEYKLDTNTNGEPRAFVQSGAFEKVVPMDILPVHLLKAILAEDYDEMEALGIYEVIEEDFALCEFIDVSKHNVQSILRDGLNLLQNS